MRIGSAAWLGWITKSQTRFFYPQKQNSKNDTIKTMDKNRKTIVFGGGCFWCTEAIFNELRGVKKVTPGYAGGTKENPTYKEVCTGKTGHAEVTRIQYDPTQITLKDLLTVFFLTHDPTTMNQQGNDVGPQYRSIILFEDKESEKQALEYIKELTRTKIFSAPIVTEVKPLEAFYEAEDYHKKYFEKNTSQPYCKFIIAPKIEKLYNHFDKLLKSHQK